MNMNDELFIGAETAYRRELAHEQFTSRARLRLPKLPKRHTRKRKQHIAVAYPLR